MQEDVNDTSVDAQQIQSTVSKAIQEFTTTMVKWVTSVLTLALPDKTPQQLNSAVNQASEEMLHCHPNILKSVHGHIFIGKEAFKKKLKANLRVLYGRNYSKKLIL